MDYEYLRASDGNGDAALMHIENERSIGSTTIEVDTLNNVPEKFIATSGVPLPSGFLDPSTICNFYGHTSSGALEIDGFLPGSTDEGNTTEQVVIIKPNTFWTDKVAEFIEGIVTGSTPINATFGDLVVAALSASSLAVSGNSNLAGNLTVDGNLVLQGTSALLSQETASVNEDNKIIPTSQVYSVTALAAAATIEAPSFTAIDRMSGELRIKDNGVARALTWTSAWAPIGVTLPTTTVAGKYMYISYEYCEEDTKYHVLGIARQA